MVCSASLSSVGILVSVCLAASAATASRAFDDRPKPSYKVLYHNDMVNITCSPYRRVPGATVKTMIEGTVDETAELGVDVQMLYPLIWVPSWQSSLQPIQAQARWFAQHYSKMDLSIYQQYALDGGDIVGDFVTRCREKGISPFVGIALNHAPGSPEYTGSFYQDNPQYLIGPNPDNPSSQDFSSAEVRQYRIDLIRELCENYDIDGVHLDFLRYPIYFDNWADPPYLSIAERVAIMTDFVSQVRAILNRTAREGQYRWLSARVPHLMEAHDDIGIDIKQMYDAGLDMAIVSSYYWTNQQTDLPEIRSRVPNMALYMEISYCNSRGSSTARWRHYTGSEQAYTTAHVGYSQGADGVALHNFVYNRAYQKLEPAFDIVPHLSHPKWLADQPQWYMLDYLQNHYHGEPRPRLPNIPVTVSKGETENLDLYFAPTSNHDTDGLLRIMVSNMDFAQGEWTVEMNGHTLEATAFVDKPMEHAYETTGFSDPKHGWSEQEKWGCYICPRDYVDRGNNVLSVTRNSGKGTAWILYIDLTFPTKSTQ